MVTLPGSPGAANARPLASLLLVALLPLMLGGLCEGGGKGGGGLVTQTSDDPRCAPVSGKFPSGFDLLPGVDGQAVVMQFQPPALLSFDLDAERPRNISPNPVPPFPNDSDGDGQDDALRFVELGICGGPVCVPKMGSAYAIDPRLVLVSASTYDELIFFDPVTADLVPLRVGNPAARPGYDPADYPVLPQGGATELRTAVSTKTCVYPPDPISSAGTTIGSHALCAPGTPSYLTKFTNEKVLAGDRLFVATANRKTGATFYPGTVLLYEVVSDAAGTILRPDAEVRMIFTSHFNPTGTTRHENRDGRELVLVTLTGAISERGEILSEGAIDVIDVATRSLVAIIPLGLAAPAFGPIAIDPTGRVAMLGSATRRHLYAIDLAPLDDPGLYDGSQMEPVLLDGSTPGFPDARIFDADNPLVLPSRVDGPPLSQCPTITNVAIDHSGALAFATDWCDGTLAVVELDLDEPFELPLQPERFRVQRSIDVLAPKVAEHLGDATSPSMIRVRPGRPGIDFTGPDVFFIANEPDGQFCGLEIVR